MSSKGVFIIAGYGTGVSHAVASLFGKKGYQLALIARNSSKLDKAVQGMFLAPTV